MGTIIRFLMMALAPMPAFAQMVLGQPTQAVQPTRVSLDTTLTLGQVQCAPDSTQVVYIAEANHYEYNRIRACSTGMVDLDHGTAMSLYFVPGRLAANRRNALVYARPNTACYLHVPHDVNEDLAGYSLDPRYPWESMPVVPPFFPTRVVPIGRGDGVQFYGYTNLNFLPGYASLAAPLNRNSVIIGMNGYAFGSTYALQGMLNDSRPLFVEVIFFQSGDPQMALYRAFIPLQSRQNVASQWAMIAHGAPVYVRDDSTLNQLLGLAAGLTIAAIVGHF